MGYNYASFPVDGDQETFDAFPTGLRTGDRAPDGTLTDVADGSVATLSSFWKKTPLVIEFGSLT